MAMTLPEGAQYQATASFGPFMAIRQVAVLQISFSAPSGNAIAILWKHIMT
jgi:hypothetical protein